MNINEITNKPRIFLDCDGVLADFDAHATEILGMPPHEYEAIHKAKGFWKAIHGADEFFYNLPLMHDAMDLFNAVKHLNPIILTGCPIGDWAPPQKQRWAKEYFPGTQMITCMAREKITHIENPGDILIDDKTKYQPIWEEGGGVFIHHTSATESIAVLKEMGIL